MLLLPSCLAHFRQHQENLGIQLSLPVVVQTVQPQPGALTISLAYIDNRSGEIV